MFITIIRDVYTYSSVTHTRSAMAGIVTVLPLTVCLHLHYYRINRGEGVSNKLSMIRKSPDSQERIDHQIRVLKI